MRYLALLRGINVGGKNVVRMHELRACLERVGLKNVTTYIQSGNVLFESQLQNAASLTLVIEQALPERLPGGAQVVVVPCKQLERVVTKAPAAFGTEPGAYRYDVIFVKEPLLARDLLPAVSLKEGVDQAFEKHGVLYFQRLISGASQSHLPKLVTTPAYKSMTVRNWNTTTRLYELMRAQTEELSPPGRLVSRRERL